MAADDGDRANGGGAPQGRCSYTVTARSSAPVEAVWSLLGEARRWKEWSFLDRSDLLREGDPPPDGVGALRRFTRFGVGSTEEVVAWEPPHHLAYVIIKGFPVRNYRADVRCRSAGASTVITWSGTFDPIVPGSGPVLRRVLMGLIGRFATNAAHYADRQAAASEAAKR